MPDQNPPDTQTDNEPTESFGDLLSQYEREHSRKSDEGPRQLQGTVVAITAESVLLDIGYKTEGILPLSAFQNEEVKPGDKFPVSVKGRDPEGYYELSRSRVARPKDWNALGARLRGKVRDHRHRDRNDQRRIQRRCRRARLHARIA